MQNILGEQKKNTQNPCLLECFKHQTVKLCELAANHESKIFSHMTQIPSFTSKLV